MMLINCNCGISTVFCMSSATSGKVASNATPHVSSDMSK